LKILTRRHKTGLKHGWIRGKIGIIRAIMIRGLECDFEGEVLVDEIPSGSDDKESLARIQVIIVEEEPIKRRIGRARYKSKYGKDLNQKLSKME
jgi:hypothetical protein